MMLQTTGYIVYTKFYGKGCIIMGFFHKTIYRGL